MNNVKDEYQIVTSKVARLPSLGWLELHGKPSNIIVENFTTSSSWLGLMYSK